ncbi:RHS repeat-associated core domain-containing protein [Pseudomonas sp. SWRI153]|uniref:RHS repeat-associated core domain-containing protein n=1 Tax=Pseudomonas khorasanensis TaxID=2745508 RepID=A0A923F276_9PSED|nr:RHS repeat-associated core domain-containing protein [Pseudomonas khorasanensis]MBV4485396.1 RHS repeat-associated core domain-containing protein [Pseudomonas khorasanensis]
MTASVHRRTPSLVASDSRGLPIRQIAYLRTVVGATATALLTRQQHDAAARLVAQWDPRLSRPNLTTVYGLDGEPLKVDSVDAGWRLNLPGLAGETVQSWDARGSHWRTTYDDQLRVVAVEENAQAAVETFTYADASADARQNLRGQLREQVDRSGALHQSSYSLLGQPLHETRTFEDARAFVSRRRYSPLGGVLELIDAGEHRQQSSYDLAGQLRHVQLQLKGQTGWQPVLLGATYNAAGQIVEQKAGNGIISTWIYDSADARLHRQSAQHNQQSPLQNLEYEYDPMGNITRIVDHAFIPSHFANQRVDGHREFSYDSLYRLIRATGYDDAPPSDIPGLPQPTDPKNRLNYTQTYAYDDGGNLIKSCHTRDGNCHSRQMFVDPNSNRAVRWKPAEADPDFDVLFDRHGNLQDLKQGPSLQWNARDELQSVSLVTRKGSDSDAERYRYSQGQRVFKCHEWFTQNRRHFHQVRYLPGLEIRNKDNGEELHIISVGNARCLHWVANPPAANDQLRYRLEDHLGSCVKELDENATVTSEEGYYPFGETAWMAPQSEIQYRFIRYSGKEMDVSGLYYYGARYYAPWLQRWVSADPAGNVDGLNLYGFVGNNPVSFVDVQGNSREKREIVDFSNFVTILGDYSATTFDQLQEIAAGKFGGRLLANFVGEFVNAVAGFVGGYLGAMHIGSILPDDPHVANFTQQSKPPFSEGLIGGNIGGDIVGAISSRITSRASLIKPLIPQTSAISVAAIDQETGIAERTGGFDPADASALYLNRVVGSVVPGVGMALAMGQRVQEAEDIKNGLDPVKIQKIETTLDDWKKALASRMAGVEQAFRRLGQNTVNTADVTPNTSRLTTNKTIRLDTLREQTKAIVGYIESSQTFISWYKEDALTDNRYSRKLEHGKPRPKSQTSVRTFR